MYGSFNTIKLRKIPYNGKLRSALEVVYQNLHILAYYRGGIDTKMIKFGIERVEEIINIFSKT
jgi:hypothetical protein